MRYLRLFFYCFPFAFCPITISATPDDVRPMSESVLDAPDSGFVLEGAFTYSE